MNSLSAAPFVYKHKYIQGMTCEIIEFTRRGAKVKQLEPARRGTKVKKKIAFYDAINFDKEKGFWIKQ